MDLGGWSSAGARPLNEDSYLVLDFGARSDALSGLRAFLAVSDGMGGHASGEIASSTAISTAEIYVGRLLSMAADAVVRVDPAVALSEIIEEANRAVLAASEGAGMGATFTAAFVGEGRLWVGHAGDSRAYVLNGDEAIKLTADHSRVGRMVDDGVITEAEGQRHPERHIIENALGFGEVKIELKEVSLAASDAVLLCTDGVHGVLSDKMMITEAAKAKDASGAAKRLSEAAVAAGSDDNVTAVLWSEDWGAFRAGVSSSVGSVPTGAAIAAGGGTRAGRRKRTPYMVAAIVIVLAVLGAGAWYCVRSATGQSSVAGANTTVITTPDGKPAVGTAGVDTTSTTASTSTSLPEKTSATGTGQVTTTSVKSTKTTTAPKATTTTKPAKSVTTTTIRLPGR